MRSALQFVFLSVSLCAAPAADWPQYRGPAHDGISQERINKWPESGPKQLWKVPMNTGFSSIAVAEGIATTFVAREKDGAQLEFCIALDANSGKELWAAPLK